MKSLIPVLYIIGSLFFLAGSLVTFFTPREDAPIIELTPDDGSTPQPQPPPARLDNTSIRTFSEYELGLLFRGTWLMEQKVKTELEFSRLRGVEVPPSIMHKGLVDSYKFEFRMTNQQATEGV